VLDELRVAKVDDWIWWIIDASTSGDAPKAAARRVREGTVPKRLTATDKTLKGLSDRSGARRSSMPWRSPDRIEFLLRAVDLNASTGDPERRRPRTSMRTEACTCDTSTISRRPTIGIMWVIAVKGWS
jgi:hypothetical protein